MEDFSSAEILFMLLLLAAMQKDDEDSGGGGAALGFLASLGIVALMGFVPMQDFVGTPTISPMVVGVTMTLLAIIALMAGWFPARRAASLDPVECLRY